MPTALLPRFGVTWTAESDRRITARFAVGDAPIALHLRIDTCGRAVSFVFPRWGDPKGTGAWDWHPFGGDVTDHRTFGGVTVPAAGRIGWFPGTRDPTCVTWIDGAAEQGEGPSVGGLVPGSAGSSAPCPVGVSRSTLRQ